VTLGRAQRLRQNPTPAERRLWRLLYPLRTGGYHFRKQVQIGPYVADFACHHAHLVVEVDGDTHGSVSASAYDAARDAYLQSRDFRVLRFANRDVMTNGDGVLSVVSAALADTPAHSRAARIPN
jgi:very-short-patch-repair endonuclease